MTELNEKAIAAVAKKLQPMFSEEMSTDLASELVAEYFSALPEQEPPTCKETLQVQSAVAMGREPVAYIDAETLKSLKEFGGLYRIESPKWHKDGGKADIPLYLASPVAHPLRDEEVERLKSELADMRAALDKEEIAHGLTSNGNLWRFWAEKAKASADKLAALQPDPCTFPSCNCFDTNVCGKGGSGEFPSNQPDRAGSGDAGRVKIKPLEWDDRSDDNSRNSYAKTSIGRYEAFEFRMDGLKSGPKTVFGWSGPWTNADQMTDSFEEAKAAAQADYEQRIRSALTTDADRPDTGKEGE